jgi:hypothetical protein
VIRLAIVAALIVVGGAAVGEASASRYPGTPTVTTVTVRGGDFVAVDYQAGGFYRASQLDESGWVAVRERPVPPGTFVGGVAS